MHSVRRTAVRDSATVLPKTIEKGGGCAVVLAEVSNVTNLKTQYLLVSNQKNTRHPEF